jgi:hypothetical protein
MEEHHGPAALTSSRAVAFVKREMQNAAHSLDNTQPECYNPPNLRHQHFFFLSTITCVIEAQRLDDAVHALREAFTLP